MFKTAEKNSLSTQLGLPLKDPSNPLKWEIRRRGVVEETPEYLISHSTFPRPSKTGQLHLGRAGRRHTHTVNGEHCGFACLCSSVKQQEGASQSLLARRSALIGPFPGFLSLMCIFTRLLVWSCAQVMRARQAQTPCELQGLTAHRVRFAWPPYVTHFRRPKINIRKNTPPVSF